MRGRLIYADVPHEVDRRSWLSPLLLGSNAALYATHLTITPTATVVFREPFVVESEADRPLIYITWHRLNYISMPMFLSLRPEVRPTIVAHDGIASRAFSHHSTAWMGFETFVFRKRSKVSARQQIAEYIQRTGRPILNLPDSGGPYGVMKPGILQIAQACNARIIPFQLSAARAISVGRTLKHVIPLPYCRIEVRRGATLDGTATVEECQRALDALA